jgi:MFS transporter, DHA1 family, multidrug resistance protein
LFRRFLELEKNVYIFLLSDAFYGLASGIIALTLNLHIVKLGYSENEVGTVASVGALMTALSAIPTGILADKYGRRNFLIAGTFMLALGSAWQVTGTSLVSIIVGQAIYSAGLGLCTATEFPLVISYCRANQQTTAYSAIFANFTLMSAIGTVAAGYLIKVTNGGSTPYQHVLYLAALLFVVCTLIRFGLFSRRTERDTGEPAVSIVKQMSPSRNVLLFGFAAFLLQSSIAVFFPLLNLYFSEAYRLDARQIGWILTINSCFMFIGSLVSPALIDRIGHVRFSLYAHVILMAALGGLALAGTPSVFIPFLFGRSFTVIGLVSALDSRMMEALHDTERSQLAAYRSIFGQSGIMVAAQISGFLLTAGYWKVPFLISLLMVSLNLLYYVTVVRSLLVGKPAVKKAA